MHVYNRQGHHVAADALSLFPKLGVEKRRRRTPSISAQELMKAEIALLLGKRYAQDEPLTGASAPTAGRRTDRAGSARATLQAERRIKADADDPRKHRDDDQR